MRVCKNTNLVCKSFFAAVLALTLSVSTGALASGSHGGGHGHDKASGGHGHGGGANIGKPGKASDVIDACGGLEDLERRRLRVLHSRSFHDDPTRAWRAHDRKHRQEENRSVHRTPPCRPGTTEAPPGIPDTFDRV